MEEAAQYEEYTKEELIQIIVDLKQTIGDLKKEIEALKPPVPKDSTNSSIPSSKDRIRRTRVSTGKERQESRGLTGTSGSSPRTQSSSRCHRHGPRVPLSELWGIAGRQRRDPWSDRPGSGYPCHHSLNHRVPASDQGLCLWRVQLSPLAHRGICQYWATDGGLDHLFECGTCPSL